VGPALATAKANAAHKQGRAEAASSDSREEAYMQGLKPFKARPMPVFAAPGAAAAASSSKQQLVEPEPFVMPGQLRHEMAQAKFQAKLQALAEREAQAHEVKATPIMQGQPLHIAPAGKSLTTPAPFQLASDERHQMAQMELQHKVAEEQLADRRAFCFKATPIPSSHERPDFEVERSDKPLAEAGTFVCHSDMRAQQRKEFDEQMAQKEQCAKASQAKALEEKEKNALAEISQIRKSMAFRAKPTGAGVNHAPVPLVEAKKMTVPKSPHLATKQRGALKKKHGAGGADENRAPTFGL
jgi:hypothetical protein